MTSPPCGSGFDQRQRRGKSTARAGRQVESSIRIRSFISLAWSVCAPPRGGERLRATRSESCSARGSSPRVVAGLSRSSPSPQPSPLGRGSRAGRAIGLRETTLFGRWACLLHFDEPSGAPAYSSASGGDTTSPSPNPAGLAAGSRWSFQGGREGERPPVRSGRSVRIPKGCQIAGQVIAGFRRLWSGTPPGCVGR